MDDKAIRKILISALKVRHNKIRIFHEKAIGGSICDLMAVTDCIIGYEIKSDLDNYARIESQIKYYDTFFNYNYIVVGENHARTVENKVPDYWGIIVIRNDGVDFVRSPGENYNFKIEKQLSILWKLELKNLLNFFRLPMYALKSKEYIITQLKERVIKWELSKQIANELMNRDYSVYNAEDYTEIYEDNEGLLREYHKIELVDQVSEMDLQDMTLDQWIDIYRKAKEIKEIRYEVDKEIVRPKHEITYKDIEATPGVPWISKEIIDEFILYLTEGLVSGFVRANYESITGNWFIQYKNEANRIANCTVKYGLKQYNALHIFEAALNLREIKLYDSERKYDEESTIAAIEKKKLIIDLFKKWVWEDEDRIWEIEEKYNELFGKYKKEYYDGSKLKFDGMETTFELFDYQKDAVKRIISTDNTLLAFDVGAGKTFIMIAAAMTMRQQGLSRKNMFVVPNNIVGQWEKIFTELYPCARLLVIDPKNFKRPVRDKAMEQMRDGDYDGIIIAYSCFEQIPISTTYIVNEANKKVKDIEEAIYILRGESGSSVALENIKKRILKTSYELVKSMDIKRNTITFDELEINTLFLDEAHNYKNLPIRTKMKNLRGINTKGSAKCLDMFQKVRLVQNTNDGRGVVFATGTPLCNSIADAYTMQMYLQYDEMVKTRFEVFDNWVKTFAHPENVAEIDVDTQYYRFVTRFAKFFNLPELSRMFSQVAIFHAMSDKDGIPVLNEYSDCVIKKNKNLSEYMMKLSERTELIRLGEVDRKKDNMLKVSIDGRKAALDLRLVNEEQSDITSKLIECVKNVKDIYDKNESCSQIVFCDYSTPKKDDFNVYKVVKEKLIELGIPKNEIAFIHSFHTEEKKVALYKKVNDGEVRVLLGSTFKLGIGANVQTRLKAVHHLDVPWRPADMVQREGRILRRGNINKEVLIFRYICEGSFDAYSWQILESKQRFISQFLSGSTYQRTASDLEENVLSYGEVKALAISDPRMKELAEKENEIGNIRIISVKFNDAQVTVNEDIKRLEGNIEILNNQITGSEKNIETIVNKTEIEYKKMRELFKKMIGNVDLKEGRGYIGDIWGFTINFLVNQSDNKMLYSIEKNGAKYTIEAGEKLSGNAIRISNFFKGLPDYICDLKEKLVEKQSALRQLKEKENLKNPYIDRINCLENEIKKLINDMELDADEDFFLYD